MKSIKNNLNEILIAVFIWLISISVFVFFVYMLGQLFLNGFSEINLSFITEATEQAGRAGGIGPILVSTFLILFVCLATALPIGLATALLISEFNNTHPKFTKWTRFSLDTLAGVPSIVFGLFGNAFFCIYLKLGFSILAGGLTLACMVLPILIRSIELSLRSLPGDDRLTGSALALSKTTILFKLLLPAAVPGFVMGIVLGVGRAIAETAALIFTSGYVDRMPESLLDSGRALAVHIFDLSMNVPGGDKNAFKSTAVILMLIFLINATTTLLADLWIGRKVIRQWRT